MRLSTGLGDDGSTGLLYGGRVPKDDPLVEVLGAVDEAVAVLGLARAAGPTPPGSARHLLAVQRGLFVAAADLATNPHARDKLVPGVSVVTAEMVADLESLMDELVAVRPLREAFVVPGETLPSAALDLARTVVRRAERRLVALTRAREGDPTGLVLRYLNRLSDLLYVLARQAVPGEEPLSHESLA